MAEKSALLDDPETCKGYTIPSNEEITNELIKDLHSACVNTAKKTVVLIMNTTVGNRIKLPIM